VRSISEVEIRKIITNFKSGAIKFLKEIFSYKIYDCRHNNYNRDDEKYNAKNSCN